MPRVTLTVPDQNAQPYRFPMDRPAVTLGRGSENDIIIDSGSVSVKHAEMWRVEGGYELRDVGSTNGIKLDDERFQVIPLFDGTSATLGDVAFDFALAEEELEILAQERSAAAAVPPPDEAVSSGPPRLPPLRDSTEPPGPITPPVAVIKVNKDLSGYAMTLLFLLAVMTFYAGLALRFRKETGDSLWSAIRAKPQTLMLNATKAAGLPPAPPATSNAATPETSPPEATLPAADPLPVSGETPP